MTPVTLAQIRGWAEFYAPRICRNPEDAADVAQVATLKGWKLIQEDPLILPGVVRRSIYNAAIDAARRIFRRQAEQLPRSVTEDWAFDEMKDAPAGLIYNPWDAIDDRIQADLAAPAMTEGERFIVQKRMEGVQYDEIAALLGEQTTAVKTRHHRMIKRVQFLAGAA